MSLDLRCATPAMDASRLIGTGTPRRLLQHLMLILALMLTVVAGAQVAVPPYQSFVTDLTGTLSPSAKSALEQRLQSVQQQNIAEMAVLIVPSTDGEAIFDYAMRVAEQWKVGSKAKDDGVLLVIAKNDHASQILVGYGLEGTLTDIVCSSILRNVVPPYFRKGDFAGGINAAVGAMLQEIHQPGSVPVRHPAKTQHGNNLIFVLFIAAMIWPLVARALLRPILGTPLTALVSGGTMFGVALLLGLPLVFALFLTVFTAVGAIGNRGRHYGGFGGGGFGGGGFGGGGFSGGGGGSFGGGGASGSW